MDIYDNNSSRRIVQVGVWLISTQHRPFGGYWRYKVVALLMSCRRVWFVIKQFMYCDSLSAAGTLTGVFTIWSNVIIIDSSNGLPPHSQQVIDWTSDGTVLRCTYTSPGLKALIMCLCWVWVVSPLFNLCSPPRCVAQTYLELFHPLVELCKISVFYKNDCQTMNHFPLVLIFGQLKRYQLSWIRLFLGTSWLRYELPCVRVVSDTIWPGYGFSWARVALGINFCVRVVLGTSSAGMNCLEFSWVRIVHNY